MRNVAKIRAVIHGFMKSMYSFHLHLNGQLIKCLRSDPHSCDDRICAAAWHSSNPCFSFAMENKIFEIHPRG